MAYIRLKSIRGIRYAYLVESVWDKERRQPKQRTIKYLGRVEGIRLDDIPEECRNDPNILRFFNELEESKMGRNDGSVDMIKEEPKITRSAHNNSKIAFSEDNKRIIEMLSSGNMEELMGIYKTFLERYRSKSQAMLEFYERIIIPALNEVGHLWMRDELGIAIEHVCSNTTLGLIQMIESYNAQMANGDANKGNVLICTPYGDLHSIPCKMVESILMSKGYKVYNIAPSTPRETVMKYVQEIKPSMVIVSVTLSSRAKASERLVKELLSRYDNSITIIVGGRGSSEMSIEQGVIRAESLSELASLL